MSDFWTQEFSEIARNWAIVAGGAIGLWIAYWRGRSHDRQSSSLQEQARIAQRAHVSEVFKDAVTQLGDKDNLEVRLGAVFTLIRIASDFPEFDPTVTKLLTAYIRERSTSKIPEDEPTGADVAEILEFVRRHD